MEGATASSAVLAQHQHPSDTGSETSPKTHTNDALCPKNSLGDDNDEERAAMTSEDSLSSEPAGLTLPAWTPSKITALDPNNVEIRGMPRAWERVPTLSRARRENGRVGLVWRTYDLRRGEQLPQTTTATGEQVRTQKRIVPATMVDVRRANAPAPVFTAPAIAAALEPKGEEDGARVVAEEQRGEREERQDKVVKRLRVGQMARQGRGKIRKLEVNEAEVQTGDGQDDGELGVPTKWDRRRSTLTRKQPFNLPEAKPTETDVADMSNTNAPIEDHQPPTPQRRSPIKSPMKLSSKNMPMLPTLLESADLPMASAPDFASSIDETVDATTQNGQDIETMDDPSLNDHADEVETDEDMILLQVEVTSFSPPSKIVALEQAATILVAQESPDDLPEISQIAPIDVATEVTEEEISELGHDAPVAMVVDEILPNKGLLLEPSHDEEIFVHESQEQHNEEMLSERESATDSFNEQLSNLITIETRQPAEDPDTLVLVDVSDPSEAEASAESDTSDDSVADEYAEEAEDDGTEFNLNDATISFLPATEDLIEAIKAPSTPPHQLVNIDGSDTLSLNRASPPLLATPKLDPPSPTFEEVTATMTFTTLTQLEDDKAILQSFLDRAAAKRSDKLASNTGSSAACKRKESLENRRHSDVIRQALASPRQPLEAKDGNLFSPRKPMEETDALSASSAAGQDKEPGDAAAGLILPPLEDLVPIKPQKQRSPRRSARARKEASVSKRMPTARASEDALVALQTRTNTRKNKGTALSVIDRLVKLRAELTVFGMFRDSDCGTTASPLGVSESKKRSANTPPKRVKWREHLWMRDQATGEEEMAPLLDNAQPLKGAAGAATSATASATPLAQVVVPALRAGKVSTRGQAARLRKLGAMNGTPAKEILGQTVIPGEAAELQEQQLQEAGNNVSVSTGSPKRSVGVGAVSSLPKKARSRLPAPKKLLNLNPSVASVTPAVPVAMSSSLLIPAVVVGNGDGSREDGTVTLDLATTTVALKGKVKARGGSTAGTAKKTASLLPSAGAPRRAARTKT